MKIESISFEKAQLGWICKLWVAMQTNRQFTWARYDVEGLGVKGWHGFWGVVSSFISAWRKCGLTKRALDGAKTPRKSKRSTGSPRR